MQSKETRGYLEVQRWSQYHDQNYRLAIHFRFREHGLIDGSRVGPYLSVETVSKETV